MAVRVLTAFRARLNRSHQFPEPVQLLELTGSPIVELNRAVAVAMCDGPSVALALVERVEASGSLKGYYLLPATRADLLRRLERRSEGATAYREALELVGAEPERRFLIMRLSGVAS